MKNNNIIPQMLVCVTDNCFIPDDWIISSEVTTGTGTITGSVGGTTGWTNSATSQPTTSPTTCLEFTLNLPATESIPSMVGLGQNETNNSYQDIDCAFYILQNVGANYFRIYVFESGANQGLLINDIAGFGDGKDFKIRITNGLVEYLFDGNVIYTSTKTASGNYYLDSSFYFTNFWSGQSTIENIKLC